MALHGGSSIPLFSFQTIFPLILLLLPSTRQVTSCSPFVVQSVLRSGHKFLIPLWWVRITCFHCHMMFSFSRNVSSSAKFLAHTHNFSFQSTNLSRTLAVHRIEWCFEPVGAGRAESVPCCSSFGRHQRHKRRWERYGAVPAKIAVQKDIQNEKSLGPVILGNFLQLGPQILRQNPAISIAVFVARTSLCWLMVTTKFCDTSRAANIFPATNVWRWRRQAGKCWVMRGTPWVQQKLSDNGRR